MTNIVSAVLNHAITSGLNSKLLGGLYFDEHPENPSFPYGVFGHTEETPEFSFEAEYSEQHTVNLTFFSPSLDVLNTLRLYMRTSFDWATMVYSGHDCTAVIPGRGRFAKDPDRSAQGKLIYRWSITYTLAFQET